VAALKDAAIAAGIAAALFLFFFGLHTVPREGGLSVETRWPALAVAVAIVFAGRLALTLTRAARARMPAPRLTVPEGLRGTSRWFAPALIAFALILPMLPFADRRIMDIAILVTTYVMLGWGLNIVVGLAGLLDLGYVAFYAVGAYSFTLLSLNFGLGFWACLPLAGMIAGLFGIALGFPVLRLRGDYLAIVTLGFGEMIRIVIINWVSLTKGPNGITGVPRPNYFGLASTPLERIVFLYYLILALALITNFVTLRLRRLPLGRAWEALREDEIACRALGINPTNVKLSAFALGATFGGIAGAFFATRQGFISPESFTFIESAIILAIVVLGGMGSQLGVALAAFVLMGIPEWFREFQQFRMLIFGLCMVLIMVWRPGGLLAVRAPTIRLGRAG
jgi:branched-chain amino acid transport system permease protein